MKNLILFLFAMIVAAVASAQEPSKKSSTETSNQKVVMQDGNSATQNNKAVMQDGNSAKSEKKAVMQDGNSKLADHKCNDKCKSGKHEYLHGEKGHQCVEACKKPHSDKR